MNIKRLLYKIARLYWSDWLIDWLIDWTGFYAVSAIFQPCICVVCCQNLQKHIPNKTKQTIFQTKQKQNKNNKIKQTRGGMRRPWIRLCLRHIFVRWKLGRREHYPSERKNHLTNSCDTEWTTTIPKTSVSLCITNIREYGSPFRTY